jgi:hypothetical protein
MSIGRYAVKLGDVRGALPRHVLYFPAKTLRGDSHGRRRRCQPEANKGKEREKIELRT